MGIIRGTKRQVQNFYKAENARAVGQLVMKNLVKAMDSNGSAFKYQIFKDPKLEKLENRFGMYSVKWQQSFWKMIRPKSTKSRIF
ncbi:hypothetical protein Trydic_g3353 [Trypoxylus dichotomus]